MSRAPSAGEVGADDTGTCSGSDGSADPMSTGNEFLDKALVLHLHICNRLLLVRTGAGAQRWGWPWLPAASGPDKPPGDVSLHWDLGSYAPILRSLACLCLAEAGHLRAPAVP